MKKKLIIVIIILICLIVFLFKDFIIRQYFISKIEYVDYDEYIMTHYIDGKKTKITYVGDDFMAVREYDENEELTEFIIVYDYEKSIVYQYNNETIDIDRVGVEETRPFNVNNDYVLQILRENNKIEHIGEKSINNRKCYVLTFTSKKLNEMTIYLDKELLYTVRREEHYNNKKENSNIVYEYNLDLELKDKDLFEKYIK